MGLFDFMKDPPKMEINVAQMTSIIEEATKAKFMLNGIECKVPHEHMYEMVTGLRHPATVRKDVPCFIPEEAGNKSYPLCMGRGFDSCLNCDLYREPKLSIPLDDDEDDNPEDEEHGG